MSFNSILYAIFLPVVFLLYHFVFGNNYRKQNILLVISSYVFYSFWDYRFVALLICSTLLTWYLSRIRSLHSTAICVILNLLILITFKYFNFFGDGIIQFLKIFGYTADWVTIDILLPIGISFYILQAISYTIDCHKGDISPTKDLVAFACYMSFFPQLVAGPIEKSTSLLPQFLTNREFSYNNAVVGLRQILWGLYKKLAVADLAGIYVDRIIENAHWYTGSSLLLAFILFSFQIYGDFSGYSDIAIGSARLFGIRLSVNFRYPFFASSIQNFWQRWHISLMNWMKDYVYIPLGGSRRGSARTYLNIVVVFLLSGLWHGANIMFLIWGLYCGITVILSRLFKKESSGFFTKISGIAIVFATFTFGMVLFRSDTPEDALFYYGKIFSKSLFEGATGFTPFLSIIPMLAIEFSGRNKIFPLQVLKISPWMRWILYAILFYSCIFAAETDSSQFIYFAF